MPKRKRKDKDGLYRRGDSLYWWASYVDAGGKRTRRSTGTADRKEAEAILSNWRSETFRQRVWGDQTEKSDFSFDQVLLAYLRNCVPGQRSGERRVKATLKPLYAFFTGRSMNHLGDVDVKAYIRHRQSEGVSAATINKEIGAMSAAINHAREELGWNMPNPAARKKLTEPEGVVRWITPDEARILLHAAAENRRAPHLVDFIQLLLNTACRAGEVLGLEWARVDLKKNLFVLEAEHNKGRKRYSVPLNEAARQALLSRASYRAQNCPASPWVFCSPDGTRIQSVKRSFGTACRQAGIANFRIHDCRHTVASWLVMEGVPLIEVRDVLRHSTVKMTERYAHLHPENVRAVVGKIRGVSRFSHVKERKHCDESPDDAATS